MPLAATRQTMALLGRYGLGLEVNTNGGGFTIDTELCPTAKPFPPLVDFWARQPQVHKIFAFSQSRDALARARQVLQTQPDVTVTTSAPWNQEVTARDARKIERLLFASQAGIRIQCEKKQIGTREQPRHML